VQSIIGDQCTLIVKDIALGPSDMITTTDETSEVVPPTALTQFDWGGICKEKEKGKGKGKGKEKEEEVEGNEKCAHDDNDNREKDEGSSTSTAVSYKVAHISK
jgi:hypothetical protein